LTTCFAILTSTEAENKNLDIYMTILLVYVTCCDASATVFTLVEPSFVLNKCAATILAWSLGLALRHCAFITSITELMRLLKLIFIDF